MKNKFLFAIFLIFSASAFPASLFAGEILLPVNADRVRIIRSLPDFSETAKESKDGFVSLDLTDEPLWIIEGDLPASKNLKPEDSPFGFHPAAVDRADYSFAKDIGVTWDRGGLYMMWVLAQPDLNKGYDWRLYDEYFNNLPDGFLPLKNITVAIDSMIKIPGRPQPPLRRRPEIDASPYLEGTSYRPKDKEAYVRWVKAAVERYGGNGLNGMPGLRTPAKYWQVDNEPPRMREGYADLVRITSRAIKEADPEAKVLIGGLELPCGDERKISNYYRTQAPLLEELNGKDVDIVDFHWFGFAGEWKELPQALKIVRGDLEKCGFKDIPIWFCEMGTYSGKPDDRRGIIELPEQTEELQAQEMLKRYAISLGEGVKKIFWAWGMVEGFGNPDDNDFFDNTGFIYDGIGPGDKGRGVKKKIYWAYQKMTQLLSYWDGSLPEKIKTSQGIYALRFRYNKDGGAGIIIAWSES